MAVNIALERMERLYLQWLTLTQKPITYLHFRWWRINQCIQKIVIIGLDIASVIGNSGAARKEVRFVEGVSL